MISHEERKTYLPVGDGRLLNVKVLLDDNLVYQGMVEDAPTEIKKLKYSKVDMGNPITYHVYSDLN